MTNTNTIKMWIFTRLFAMFMIIETWLYPQEGHKHKKVMFSYLLNMYWTYNQRLKLRTNNFENVPKKSLFTWSETLCKIAGITKSGFMVFTTYT